MSKCSTYWRRKGEGGAGSGNGVTSGGESLTVLSAFISQKHKINHHNIIVKYTFSMLMSGKIAQRGKVNENSFLMMIVGRSAIVVPLTN
jgi:hypothetical protein